MTVSMNLHDCAAKEKQRATLARQVAEYERRHGPVKTIPPQRRSPDTRVDLVINAKSLDCGKKADGKHNERNAARMTIPAVRPDHGHPITLIMLNHAQRKLRVKKADIAIELKCSPSYVSNVFNGKSPADDKRLREILSAMWKLSPETAEANKK